MENKYDLPYFSISGMALINVILFYVYGKLNYVQNIVMLVDNK